MIDSGADMQQLNKNQTVAYSAKVQARFTAKLVGFLIRDSLPRYVDARRGLSGDFPRPEP